MKLVEGYGAFPRYSGKTKTFVEPPPTAHSEEPRAAVGDEFILDGDGIDWPADVPPEYLGEPMALWSQVSLPPGGTAPFAQEALRNPYDDAFFEVHGCTVTLANPDAAAGAIMTLATLGISIALADDKDQPQHTITKDYVPANLLFGMRGAPFATPYNQPGAFTNTTMPFATTQIRFAHPWLVPPRWMLQAACASRGAAVQTSPIVSITFQGRKVPGANVTKSTTRLPYHCGYQFTPVLAGATGEMFSTPADLMNVTGEIVHVTSIIGGLTQFMGSAYGYGAFDVFPDPKTQQLCAANPAAAATVALALSDGYPVVPPATPVRVAFALPGGDWPVSFQLRNKDFLVAQQNITLPAVVYTGDPLSAAVSVGFAGWREVAL